MNPILCFWLIAVALLAGIAYCNHHFCMLKDLSKADRQPYSWSRVQLAWWTVIVLSAFVTIILEHGSAPDLRTSTVILIGISAATIAVARSIDSAEENNPLMIRHQDKSSANFFIDILSDQTGVSIHRFQTVVFNLVFGVWFVVKVMENLRVVPHNNIHFILPEIEPNNLILLGLSSATYAALKTAENKPSTSLGLVGGGSTAPVAGNDTLNANLEEQPVG